MTEEDRDSRLERFIIATERTAAALGSIDRTLTCIAEMKDRDEKFREEMRPMFNLCSAWLGIKMDRPPEPIRIKHNRPRRGRN